MKLTTFSDYALRVLMYAGAARERLVTIEETAKAYRVSQAHLMKVVNMLTKAGICAAFAAVPAGLRWPNPPNR